MNEAIKDLLTSENLDDIKLGLEICKIEGVPLNEISSLYFSAEVSPLPDIVDIYHSYFISPIYGIIKMNILKHGNE